jgi:hypothetical protein
MAGRGGAVNTWDDSIAWANSHIAVHNRHGMRLETACMLSKIDK